MNKIVIFFLSFENSNDPFYSISIAHVVHIRMAKFAYRIPLFYKFSKLRKTEENALRVLHGFTDEMIRKRRRELTENSNGKDQNSDEDAMDEMGKRKKRVLLDILLQAEIDGKPLSDRDIREEVDVFMFEVVNFSSVFLFVIK